MSDARQSIIQQNSKIIGDFFEKEVGFRLSHKDNEPFHGFVNWFSSKSQSSQIQRLKQKNVERFIDFHVHLVNSIMVDTRKGFCASVYHLENMKRISKGLIDKMQNSAEVNSALNEMFPGSTVGAVAPNNPAILDFEFQAYLLANRRTLEYLTKGINAYFSDRSTRFRILKKSLSHKKPHSVSGALIKVLDAHSASVESLLSNETYKTKRDIVAHTGYVPFGCLNIRKDGARFHGENFLNGDCGDSIGSIEMDLNKIRGIIRDLLLTLVQEDQQL